MSFVIVKSARAWWPVHVDLVTEAGAIERHTFEMRFRLLKVDEAVVVERLAQEAREKEMAGDADLATVYAGLVERIAEDWRQVLAENGEPLPWSAASLRELMNEPRMFTKVFEAFRACLHAAPDIREGN